METAPIILFVFNRPWHTRQTVEALRRNRLAPESDLIVFSDGPRNESDRGKIATVRDYIRGVTGFREVTLVERETNWGLARSVIAGVTDVVNRFGRVIVLEDDLITSPWFLTFMNEALACYADEPRVANVQGCVGRLPGRIPETFLIRFVNSTGWGTWARAWRYFEPDGAKLLRQLEERGLTRTFDFDGAYGFTRMLRRQIAGEVDSWAIRWNASLLVNDLLAVNTGKSLIDNAGYDDSGTHSGGENIFAIDLYDGGPVRVEKIEPVEENAGARRALARYYRRSSSKLNKARVRLLRYLRLLTGRRRKREEQP